MRRSINAGLGVVCSEPKGCLYPTPKLEPEEQQVLLLFKRVRDNLHRSGMDGGPTALILPDAEAAARALGVPWDEYTLDKLLICADEVISHERTQAAKQAPKGATTPQGKPEIPPA